MVFKIGLFFLALSIGMLANSLIRKKEFGLISDDEKERYRAISKKPKEERIDEEQDFYLQNQEAYFSLQVASISFKLALVLIPLGLFTMYFFK